MNDKTPVVIRKVDSGSIWIIIGISILAISIVGQIVTMALKVKRELIEQDKMKQQVRAYKAGAGFLEALEKEATEKIKGLCQADAKKIIKENKLDEKTEKTIVNENANALAIGIEKLANLMIKGVEVYASIEAPKDVAESFPLQEERLKLAMEILKLPANTDA